MRSQITSCTERTEPSEPLGATSRRDMATASAAAQPKQLLPSSEPRSPTIASQSPQGLHGLWPKRTRRGTPQLLRSIGLRLHDHTRPVPCASKPRARAFLASAGPVSGLHFLGFLFWCKGDTTVVLMAKWGPRWTKSPATHFQLSAVHMVVLCRIHVAPKNGCTPCSKASVAHSRFIDQHLSSVFSILANNDI